MKLVAWLLAILIGAGIVYGVRRALRQWEERKRASEARMASLLAQAKVSSAPEQTPQEQLLFDAAAKTAQAGEPALAIQLYARLLSRYPQSPLAAQARAALAEQKTRLAKA